MKKDKAFFFIAAESQRADQVFPYTGVDREGQAGGVLVAPFLEDNVFLRMDFNLDPENSIMTRD